MNEQTKKKLEALAEQLLALCAVDRTAWLQLDEAISEDDRRRVWMLEAEAVLDRPQSVDNEPPVYTYVSMLRKAKLSACRVWVMDAYQRGETGDGIWPDLPIYPEGCPMDEAWRLGREARRK